LIPLAILVLFWVGFRRHEGQTLDEMLWAWILPNSIMCALLTALAGAKPLSVVTGFIASPITSLNPMVPAGVVVGLVEAWLRRPTVEDTERAVHDIQTLRGIYGNRFTRVMLVVVASTMGSALGAWVGLGWLAKIVAG
jgi:pheromone shutdown protein TraB